MIVNDWMGNCGRDGDGVIAMESGQFMGRCASGQCVDGRSFVSPCLD